MVKKKTDNKEEALIFPLLEINRMVVTPEIPQPLKIDSEENKFILNKCTGDFVKVFILTSEENEHGKHPDSSEKNKLHDMGVVAMVDRVLQMPGAPTLAFLRPLYRAKFEGIVFNPEFALARVKPLPNIEPPKRKSPETKLLMERVEELFNRIMNYIPDPEKGTAVKLVEENSQNPVTHLYALSHVAPISWEDKLEILKADTFLSLLETIASVFDLTEQKIALQASIHERTHHELSQQQKEAFLRMHMKQIREELGEWEEGDDIATLSMKGASKKWNKDTKAHFDKELQKLKRLNINNPEYSVQYSYLEAFLELPWNDYSKNKISIDKVEKILNRDHYGLEHVKERILEYMAVVKLRNDLKAPILCLYGPPGVGKTSIGKSVAEATGREYARISLGGMHDEAEIRGHRRTYIGAMPGRFLHTLSKCKHGNPLILLDEIDKVGKDYKGDPSSALLEALDPEQNNTFHDNFIDYPYDLSKVLFIATANDLSTIPAPLRDRMEIIEMKRYTNEEKREIALRHLIDKAHEDNGFNKGEVKFSTDAVDTIIRLHTHEAGVRQLAKKISAIMRKLALMKVKGIPLPEEITKEHVTRFLSKRDVAGSSLGFQA